MAGKDKVFIGLDLGDRYAHFCILGSDGEIIDEGRVHTTVIAFRKFFASRTASLVVLEAGTHSRWSSELLAELGHEVVVANPAQVRLIYGRSSKTDRLDAEVLARLGRVDPSLLSPIQHRGRQAHTDLAWIRGRDRLVQARTKLVNYLRGVTKAFGYRLPKCSAQSFHRRIKDELPKELAAVLQPHVEALADLHRQILACDRAIHAAVNHRYPEAARLAQVPGVGALTALAFVLTLDDPHRFPRSRDVGPYLGLVPRRKQSGQKDLRLGITKAGDQLLRRLLVNCAQYILGPFGKESDLRAWGLHLVGSGGKRTKKKAAIAVARRLAVMLHRLWISGEEYVAIGYHPA